MNKLKYQKTWLALGTAGIVAVLILCLLPTRELPKVSVNDKLIHFLVYFSIAAWFSGIVKREKYILFGGFLLSFSLLVEVLQGLSKYRSFEWMDLLANGIGIFSALLLGVLFLHAWCEKFESRLFKA